MPAKYLTTSKSASKKLRKLPVGIHQRVIQSFKLIKQNPIIGAKLGGELANYYKLRIGDYRIIYKFYKKEDLVEIVKVEHRQGVYR